MIIRTLLATTLAAAAAPAFAGTFGLTYSQDIKPILDNNCVECHHAGGRDPDLSQFPFQSKKLSGQQAIVQKIVDVTGGTSPKMPPGQRDKLTSSQVNTVSQWLGEGLQP